MKMSISLDPDQDPCSVGPNLGTNCLQWYQQTTKVSASKEIVKLQRYRTMSNSLQTDQTTLSEQSD